jgi:SPW repeat
MWVRYMEILIGVWLIASPWIFGHTHLPWLLWNDILCGAAVILLAGLSFFRKTRWAHLLIGAVVVWLGGTAYFLFQRPGPGSVQNEIMTALVLLLFFILPNQASDPPEPWRGRPAVTPRHSR